MTEDEAKSEIDRLEKDCAAKDRIIGILRAQIRQHGLIPCVSESKDVMRAEYKMRNAARVGN